MKELINIGSMFSGCGGFDVGLSKIGCNTVWAVDIMEEATISFKANFPGAKVYLENVHEIEDFTKLGNKKIQGLCFGPPCQGYSRANLNRSMSDPRNYAYLATLKAVKQTDVDFFIFENVVGLLDMVFDDGSSVFEKIKKDYESCGKGYTVSYKVIDCSHVGVPQANRFRLIMVGFRKDLNHTYKFDKLTHGEGRLPLVTLRDTIGHLKDVDQREITYSGPYDKKFLSRKRQKGFDEPAYTIEASARYAKIHPGYGKMRWVSQNNWEIPKECRRLSVLESKLLQCFPEDYKILGSLEKQYEQIGNAVPPKLASFIGKPIAEYYVLKQLKGIYKDIIPILQHDPYICGEKIYNFLRKVYIDLQHNVLPNEEIQDIVLKCNEVIGEKYNLKKVM